MTPTQSTIYDKLTQEFSPIHLEVINESHMHSGNATESHFKVILVSDQFEGKPMLAQHRAVNKTLQIELSEHIHALALHTYTSQQWETRQQSAPESPACKGGSKA